MRALFLCVAIVSMTGCRTKTCVDDTLLVELTRSGAAASATKLDVEVSIAGATPLTDTIAITPGSGTGTVEVKLPSYPTGEMLVVTIIAEDDNGNELATGSTPIDKLASGCERIDLLLGASDAGVLVDGSTYDGSETDGGSFSPQLNAVRPHIANTGDTIVLEGSFTQGTMVTFPGSTSAVSATLLPAGAELANRATVTVPTDATAGTMSITTGGATFTTEFRRANYALSPTGILNWEADYPQAEGAHMMVQLPQALSLHSQASVNGWLYVIGGTTNNNAAEGALGTVTRIRTQADGTLGVVDSTLRPLNTARSSAASFVVGSRIWIVGGSTGTMALGSTEYTDILSDGTINAWAAGPTLKATRRLHTASVVGNRVYVIGGLDGSGTELGSIEYATINSDGTLSAFQTVSGNALKNARAGHATFVTSSQVIVVGGTKGGSAVTPIEFATINPDGSLGAFTPSPVALPNGTMAAASALSALEVGSMLIAPPYLMQQNAQGQLQSIAASIPTPYALHGFRVTSVRDMLFITGGYSSAPSATVERIRLDGNASLDNFGPYPSVTLPSTLGYATATVVGFSVYVIAGDTLLRSKINPDDTLGPFNPVTGIGVGAINEYATGMYYSGNSTLLAVTGGYIPSMSKIIGTVQLATVAVDDTLTSDGGDNFMMNSQRAGHALVATGPYLCAIGGEQTTIECMSGQTSKVVTNSGSSPIQMVAVRGGLTSGLMPGATPGQSALIAANGQQSGKPFAEYIPAPLSQATGQPESTMSFTAILSGFTTDILGPTSVLIGSKLYFVGGEIGGQSTTQAFVVDTSPNIVGTTNAVTSSSALNAARNQPMGFRIGNSYYVIGGLDGNATITSVEQASLK